MAPSPVIPGTSCPAAKRQAGSRVPQRNRALLLGLVGCVVFAAVNPSAATLLWSDLGATQVHETGAGVDILGGVLHRDDSSSDTLYFKFHVDPLSDATTEE